MPLIHCPECRREISDRAVACPGCGYGLGGRPSGGDADPVTTQRTGKRFKGQILWAFLLGCLGVGFMLLAFLVGEFVLVPIGALLTLAAIAWWLVVSLLIWWHHE